MVDFICKKCGNKNYFLKQVENGTGVSTGVYCSQCQSWNGWIKKSSISEFEKTADSIEVLSKAAAEVSTASPRNIDCSSFYIDKAAIVDVIQTMEAQLRALKKLVGYNIDEPTPPGPQIPSPPFAPYTPYPYSPDPYAPYPYVPYPYIPCKDPSEPYKITCDSTLAKEQETTADSNQTKDIEIPPWD